MTDPVGSVAVMASDLPVSALFSQLLVAYTIELDNEFEHQMPHRTTWGPAAGSHRGPWLVSLAMWANFLRFIDSDGVALRDVEDLARLINLAGLQRWGYVTVGPDEADGQQDPPRVEGGDERADRFSRQAGLRRGGG